MSELDLSNSEAEEFLDEVTLELDGSRDNTAYIVRELAYIERNPKCGVVRIRTFNDYPHEKWIELVEVLKELGVRVTHE